MKTLKKKSFYHLSYFGIFYRVEAYYRVADGWFKYCRHCWCSSGGCSCPCWCYFCHLVETQEMFSWWWVKTAVQKRLLCEICQFIWEISSWCTVVNICAVNISAPNSFHLCLLFYDLGQETQKWSFLWKAFYLLGFLSVNFYF